MDGHAEQSNGRVMDRVRQLWCGLHGHDSLLQFEHDRMFLRCVSCGHESPGWELNEAPPTVSNRTVQTVQTVQTPARAQTLRPQFVGARRVA